MADYIDAFRDTGSAQKLQPCSSCGRTFNQKTLVRHEAVCHNLKKRKVFDTSKKRLAHVQNEIANLKVTTADLPPRPKKANWRRKHEEFISNIRGARGVTAAQKKGEPLPPPPPPTVNPDYVQCPHCDRRFNEHAAERHIGFCKEQKARIARPASKTVASEKVARRTKYKPPLPGKRNSIPSGTVSSPKATGAFPAKAPSDYRAVDYAPHSRNAGSGTSRTSARNPSSASPSSRRKLLSDPDSRSRVQQDQKKKWTQDASPSLSRRKPSAETNGSALQRAQSGDIFSYNDSDDDFQPKSREIKHGRRTNQSDSENERADTSVYNSRRRRERPDSNSSESERASSGSSAGRRHRHIAIRDPSPTLFDDFGIQSQSPVNLKNPFSAKAHLHKGLSEEASDPVAKQKSQSAGRRLSKFCHECGTKYPIANAKFCCECGTKRLHIET